MKHVLTSVAVLMALLFIPLAQAQTQLDPNAQIRWSTPITSSATGPQSKFYNGVAQADQFPGAPDACLQIKNAAVYALANTPTGATAQVNATGLQGIQQCNTDVFGALSPTIAAPLNLTVTFGATWFNTTVTQTIRNSSLALHGAGNVATIFAYAGTTASSQVLFAHAQASGFTNGLEEIDIRDMFFLGNPTYNTDTVLLQDVNRSNIMNVNAWGASNCAIHQEGNVTTTLYRVKESQREYQNIDPGGTVTTLHGWCPDKSFDSNNQTTNGTVIDNSAEFVSGNGFNILSAQTMKISGTSEFNSKGVVVAGSAQNKWLTFEGLDLEGNSANVQGVDINDLGQNNVYINPIASSACSSCHSVFAGGGGGQQIVGDSGMLTGWGGSFNVWGNNSNLNNDAGAFVINGSTQFASTSIFTHIVNSPGVQIFTFTSCSISAGAIGNTCSNTVTLPSAEPDTNYRVICQAGTGGSGLWTVGSLGTLTTTTFTIPSVALSSSATAGGTGYCSVFHQ